LTIPVTMSRQIGSTVVENPMLAPNVERRPGGALLALNNFE
jgi:hypothetical protein